MRNDEEEGEGGSVKKNLVGVKCGARCGLSRDFAVRPLQDHNVPEEYVNIDIRNDRSYVACP